MTFWKKRRPQHPSAASILDDSFSDQAKSSSQPGANPATTFSSSENKPRHSGVKPTSSAGSPEVKPGLLARSASSGSRLSRFNPFRRASTKSMIDTPPTSHPEAISPKAPPMSPPTIKTPENPNQRTLSSQIHPRMRTPTASPYASPRTSIYGALSSPSSASNPADIFERSIESVPSVTSGSPSIKGVSVQQLLEDNIPPALEATASTFSNNVNPDDVEIITFTEVPGSDRSDANSPYPPSSPILGPPVEITQNSQERSSPDIEGKKRTLSLMSAMDHLTDEIIHPPVHTISPLSLSPQVKPSDSTAPRTTDIRMERSPSQASTYGDVVVVKQNMGDVLRQQQQRLFGGTPAGHSSVSGVANTSNATVASSETG